MKPKINLEKNTDQHKGYLGNISVKRDGVQHSFTQEELEEYVRCKQSVDYFVENYIKIIHIDKGLVYFKPYDYQKKLFKTFNDNRFNVVLACRQSGKSISVCAYLLWYSIFHSDKLIAVLANKAATSKEMLSRITLMLENLPFFLQPGCKALNKGSIEFSNNTRIEAHATSSSSIRGKSVSLLYLDEFAFVENDTEFYTSTYPVVSSGKTSRVIITSTANGIGNMFHKLYEGAVQKTNEFKASRVDWWDVPGRDEKWKEQTISNTSQDQFEQEFGNSFGRGTGRTLLTPNSLLGLRAINPKEIKGDTYIYERQKENHNYVMTIDTARGRGQDYSAFNVIDVTTVPFKQVATYRNNLVSPLIFPDMIHKIAKYYNNAYLVVESNDQGSLVWRALRYDYEYENMYVGKVAQGTTYGLEMTRKTKRIGCSNVKDLIEEGKLELYDAETIRELGTFESKGTSYEASRGNHDDLVMTLVMFGYFASTNMFNYITDENIRDMMTDEKNRLIAESVPFIGSINEEDGDENVVYKVENENNESIVKFKRDDVFGIIIEEN
jgi:hypothetical protein